MSQPEVVDIHTLEDIEAHSTGWGALAWINHDSSYFQSPEWAAAWWGTLGRQAPTRIASWYGADGQLDTLVALTRVSERLHRRVPVRLRYWTNTGSGIGSADHIGFLVAPHRGDEVREWLTTLEGSVRLRNLSPGPTYLPVDAVRTTTTRCPRLTIPEGDAPIGRSAKYRKRLRRNSRILREKGLEFTAVDGPDITDEMLNRLMEMHEARSDRQDWGSTFTPQRIEFHRRLIASSDKGRGPGMMIARQDERIVGVLYGFWWNKSFSYFQTGWDPEWWELSLGTALVYEMILHVREQGATLFDFLRGPEEYKYRFGAEDQVDEDWILARGFSGRMLEYKSRR